MHHVQFVKLKLYYLFMDKYFIEADHTPILQLDITNGILGELISLETSLVSNTYIDSWG